VKRFLVSTVVMVGLGCAATKPAEETASGFRAMGAVVKVEPIYSDEAIGLEARRRVDLAGAADMAGVRLHVDGGTVTLRGSVPHRAAAWRAEAAVRSVPGVKSVVNELLVTRMATP
jgi:osmotically-inducible protein OsmY